MDPLNLIAVYCFKIMFVGALLWLYRLDKFGILVLLTSLAMPALMFGFLFLAIALIFMDMVLKKIGLSLGDFGILLIFSFSIFIIYQFWKASSEELKDFFEFIDSIIKGYKKKYFTAKSRIETASDLLNEIFFVKLNWGWFVSAYCFLILIFYNYLSPFEFSKFNSIATTASSHPIEFYLRNEFISFWLYFEDRDMVWLFTTVGYAAFIIIFSLCGWVHCNYLNWHAKKVYKKLQKICLDLEENNKYLIWYGNDWRTSARKLEIEDKLRWQKDYYFVKSKGFGQGFWIAPTLSYDDFLFYAKYIEREGVEYLQKLFKDTRPNE